MSSLAHRVPGQALATRTPPPPRPLTTNLFAGAFGNEEARRVRSAARRARLNAPVSNAPEQENGS